MSDCPTSERLRSLLDGQPSDAEQAELQQHIDECESCQQTLEGLVAGKESWDGVARRLGDAEPPVTPALHDAIAAAREMEATIPSVKLPPGLLQPAQQPDSMGRLAHYEVLEEVGSGGMGIVLKAFDTSLRRVVAIKVMAPHLAANAAARRRFVREAQAAAAVAHEHVVAIHAVADQHERPYLAMQFIEGKTLQERLDESGPLSVREVLRIGMQTAAGLAAAHAQGLVHRDIKPANILLENGVERVKLTDFGLARAVDDASVTQSGVIAGTPLFMSPEQARGEAVDHRSDLFSLGSVLYAMCVGHAPFRASTTMGVIKRVCDESPRPIRDINPDVPDWLCDIIGKMLSKNASERFASAKEVSEMLGQCLAHLQQPAAVGVPTSLSSATGVSPVRTGSRQQHRQDARGTETVEGWRLRCTTCGKTRSLASVGGVRIGAASKGKVTLSWCSVCRALRWTAVEWGEIDPHDAPPGSLSWRSRFGFVLVLLAGLLTIGWLVQSASQPVPGPAGVFFVAASELGLLLVAALGLLAGIVFGVRRFIRGLDTTTTGGRLWGTALSGMLLAAVSTGMLAVVVSVAMYRLSYSPPQIVPARLTYQLPGPHVTVTLNGEKMDVSPSGHINLQLIPGEYVIALIKNGQPEVRSGETLVPGQHKTVELNETQADAVQISGPMVMAYGPGASAPNVTGYIAIQGRWVIVSQERNGVPVTESQRGAWIEFDRGYMRSDVPNTPRYLAFLAESLVALYADESPAQIDVLNVGAKGIYRLDGDTLTLAIADAGQPRPTEFVSLPASAVTLTVCRRASQTKVSKPTSVGPGETVPSTNQ